MPDYLDTLIVEDNEIVKADDVNYISDSELKNLSLAMRYILGPLTSRNMIVEGLAAHERGTPSLNVDVDAGLAFDMTLNLLVHNGSAAGPIPFTAPHLTLDRIDVLEIRQTTLPHDVQQRAFKDPITEVISYSNVNTKEQYITQFQVKPGTPAGSPVAPTVDVGWVKIAEVKVRANTTEILDSDIVNCSATFDGDTSAGWTTDKEVTFHVGSSSYIKGLFRQKHEEDGDHSPAVIRALHLDLGEATGDVNADVIPIATDVSVGATLIASGTMVTAALQSLANLLGSAETLITSSQTLPGAGKYKVRGEGTQVTLPTNVTEGEKLEIFAEDACQLLQSDAQHQMIFQNRFFTTPGASGYLSLQKGQKVVLVYKGNINSRTEPPSLLSAPPAGLGKVEMCALAWDPTGKYLAAATGAASPYVWVYKRSGDSLSLLAALPSPGTVTNGNCCGLSWDPTSTYLAVPIIVSPYIAVYKRSGDSFNLLTMPVSVLASGSGNTGWSPDGQYLLYTASGGGAPYYTIYKRTGDSFAVLGGLPNSPGSCAQGGVAWSPDGNYCAIGTLAPYVAVLKRKPGDVFAFLPALPAPNPVGFMQGLAWTPEADLLIGINASSTPSMHVYKRTAAETFIELYSQTLGITTFCDSMGLSQDGGYFVTSSQASPYLVMARRTRPLLDTYDQVGSIPAGAVGRGASITRDGGYIAIGANATPFVSWYKTTTVLTKGWEVELLSGERRYDFYNIFW